MNNVLSALCPAIIQKSEYETIIREICDHLRNVSDDRRIREILNKYWNKPYYFKKNGDYLENKICTPSIRDVTCFYVLIKYLKSYRLKHNSESSGKAFSDGVFDAGRYYREFFSEQWDPEKEFIYNHICLEPNENSDLFADVKIDVVSGSVYKIKKYFLENSRIKDIRGGSALIKYVNEDATFEYLKNHFIEECAIYCGGGNVLIIAPENSGQKICEDLEKKYTEITLTAQNAFECIQTNLNEFIKSYKCIMSELNKRLDERKKLKIYCINPDNKIEPIAMGRESIEFLDAEKIDEKGAICYLCGVRDAKYKVYITDMGYVAVCPSCFRKHKVGEEKSIFYDEYKEFTGSTVYRKINSIIELEDDNGQIAVIYADGNNMGNVVKNIETPFQHMYFSRSLDRITKECVYNSIYEVMQNEAMFEAIALGGDDIFIIVPGDKSLEITNKIINKFDGAFRKKMTMSAGVCIAKSNTPIKTMFEVAQYMLKRAKKYARKMNCAEGTVDVQFIRSNIGIDMLESESSIFPADNSELSSYLDIIRDLREDSRIKISQLYRFSNAWRLMKNPMEFQLFYLYQTGRLTGCYNDYVLKFLKNMKKNNENVYNYCGLLQKRSGAGSSEEPTYVCLWDDILQLMEAVGR